MFEWLKKLFGKKPAPEIKPSRETKLTKPCKGCGKPISYDPPWEHIPNYCTECKAKYRAEHPQQKKITRKCRDCGKVFSFPSTVKYYPNYCRDCRRKRKEQRI